MRGRSLGVPYAHVAVFAVFALSLLGPNLSLKSEAASGTGSPLRQGLYVLTFLIAFVGIQPLQRPDRLLVLPISLLVTIAWCCLSLSWSAVPQIGLRRIMLTMLLIGTVFVAVRRAGFGDTIALMRVVLTVALMFNYVAVLLFPGIGVHDDFGVADPELLGNWRGILLQKNFAGAACAATILLMTFGGGRLAWTWRVAAALAAAYFLFRTSSKTSIGFVMAAALAGVVHLHFSHLYRKFLVPLLMAAAVAAALFVHLQWLVMLRPLDNPDSFTGRAEIWLPLVRYANDHLLTGSGYGSFWNIGGARGPVFAYTESWVRVQTSGHNGYLDLLVSIGLPGLILAVLALIVLPLGRVMASRRIPAERGALIVAILIFVAGHNMTESSLLERDMFAYVLALFAIALIGSAAPGASTRPQSLRLFKVKP